jgi:hypothetical protein
MTDRLSGVFNEAFRSAGSGLPTIVSDVERHPSLANWRGSYLPRPLFVAEREIRAFAADVRGLLDLIISLPERLYDGDLDRYCAALNIDAGRSALIRRMGGAPPPIYGRADMYHDGTSFKLLEAGIAPEMGGVDRAGEIPRAMLRNEAFAAFADQHRLGYVHTPTAVADTLRRAGQAVAPGRDPVVALLEAPGGLAQFAATWNTFAGVMRECGLEFHVAELGDLTDRDGRLHLGGTPIDVVFRCFNVEEVIAHPHGAELVEPIFRAHEEGRAVLWSPMETNLFTNKGCLGMLYEPQWRSRFTAAEHALIDRVLPWTRLLSGQSSLDDDELVARCRDRREQLILKPNDFYGGRGIVPGWEVSDDEWWRALKDGASLGCIVQERVVPRLEPVVDPVTLTEQPWQAAWGLYYTPDGYAGAYARALPAYQSALISVGAHKDTRTAGVFHYNDGDEQ